MADLMKIHNVENARRYINTEIHLEPHKHFDCYGEIRFINVCNFIYVNQIRLNDQL